MQNINSERCRISSLSNNVSQNNNEYIQNNYENINNSNELFQKPQKLWKAKPIQIKTTLSPRLQQLVQNLSLGYLTLSQTINPLMARAAHKHSQETFKPFLSSTIVFNIEITKLLICCTILLISNGYNKFRNDLFCAFLKNKKETLKVCVPAIIYVIQNNLYFFALKRVEATLFSMTFQLRILTTALLSMLLLSRIFSRIQWGALCISLLGVCLVQLSNIGKESGHELTEIDQKMEQNEEFIGLLATFVMCWTSAFAGVYLEGVLKQSSCDIWMQNIRISLITIPFALLTIANDADQIHSRGFFAGWTWRLWLIVISSSSNGLVVAAVMKYADNIKKSYCQSLALGGTALLSIIMGDSEFSFALLGGVSLVISSIFLYTLNPPNLKSTTIEMPDDDEISLMDGDDVESIEEEAENQTLDYKKSE
ncbi:hypothetical protein Mgra_00002948 [Meloidogyne graminicola]|uniref:Nucleotide-sugar transporter n=1 Tax=Meloidogyne graminicola TaxID=189291 RepID=A0A8S9ZWS5_9BILA|nr:hypothetical protein Mgra_00002948 [Meloidogyne graminicola]